MTIIQPKEFITPVNWPTRAMMKPNVSAIQRESVIPFSMFQSAFLRRQRIRPIPIRSAAKNRDTLREGSGFF